MGEISTYQIEMIRKNITRDIVKINVLNNELKYDLNGLIKVRKLDLLDIIKVTDIIKSAVKFFFYEKNFVLDKEKIHQDKKGNIKLLYIPIKTYKNKSMNLEAFIRSNIKLRWFQENVLDYSRSEMESYLLFNIRKIVYLSLVLIVSLILALTMNKFMLLVIVPLIFLPMIRISKKIETKKEIIDDRTIILAEREKINVCFSDVFGNEKNICISEHENKYIGRDKKECSLYICNSAVGRKHAKLTYVEGRILVTDNDSINNTYVNGHKLKKHKEYEIKDGDRVVFANEEYMLFLGA